MLMKPLAAPNNDYLANKSTVVTSRLPEMPESVVPKLGQMNYLSTLNRKDSERKMKMLFNRLEKLK